VVLKELLVLALEILLEDDAADLQIRMLVSQANFLLAERRVEIRIVIDLARATDAGVKRLYPVVALQGVRVEQIASLFGESQSAFVASEVHSVNKALVAEMANGRLGRVEVIFRHHSDRANCSQRAAVLAVQLVYPVAIEHELAFIAARQVHVAHQSVTRVVIIPVASVVHARPLVVAIQPAELGRIIPSSVRHKPSLWVAPVGLSVKTPWHCLRALFRESPRRRGVSPRRSARGLKEPCSGP
jgi:hypothetical protein